MKNKLLVLEDSKFFQAAISRCAATHIPAAEILLAGSLQEGLALAEQYRDKIFAILLDLTLPDANHEVSVPSMDSFGIPVIVFTGTYDEKTRENLMRGNVVDFVLKNSTASLDYLGWAVRRLMRNTGITVMVVDDSSSSREYVKELLALSRFNVLTASSGEEALELLETHPEIGLVLTDYEMPGIDGFQLVTKIREKYLRHELAVIGLSASDNAGLSTKFIKHGANDFLNKPFNREEFYCRIWQNVDLLESIDALKEAAFQDFLTGLPNRRHFFEVGQKCLATARRIHPESTIALIDIDYFKRVNDTYGHEAGDDVLRGIGDVLKAAIGARRRHNCQVWR